MSYSECPKCGKFIHHNVSGLKMRISIIVAFDKNREFPEDEGKKMVYFPYLTDNWSKTLIEKRDQFEVVEYERRQETNS